MKSVIDGLASFYSCQSSIRTLCFVGACQTVSIGLFFVANTQVQLLRQYAEKLAPQIYSPIKERRLYSISLLNRDLQNLRVKYTQCQDESEKKYIASEAEKIKKRLADLE